jgi:ABC-2 type transport system permease protein
MRILFFLLQKEFKQIFRNKSILVVIMLMPVIQLMVLPWAADYEVKNIHLSVVDHDHSAYSRNLVSKITASGYFKLYSFNGSFKQAFQHVEQDKSDIVLEIPEGFERNLLREGQQKVLIAINAINGIKAGLGGGYLNSIIREFHQGIQLEWSTPENYIPMDRIEISSSNRFNPLMNYKAFMVPGILAILVTTVGGFLAALNIVKEKEVGTMEQINVTPIKKYLFISGKLIPFWILGNVVFTLGLLVSWLVYGIVPAGNLMVLYSFIWLYLLAVLGFGLLVSTFSDTQQQALFIMFFFLMIFIMMGGLFTPIDSMPGWAQMITFFNPLKYLIEVMRMIILKGSGWRDILPHAGIIAAFALVLNGWAVWNYKKVSS